MSCSFLHYILIRFNLVFEECPNRCINPTWLEDRCRLFEQYGLPSLTQQTNSNFIAILLCSSKTPPPYKERIESYTKICKQLRVRYSDAISNLNAFYQQLGEELIEQADYLVTTRFDNDDLLGVDFVDYVQQHICVNEKNMQIIELRNGIQYFEKKELTYAIAFPHNHFTTFIEPRGKIKTSLGFSHLEISSSDVTTLYPTHPLWCEVVHGGNMCNDYTPYISYFISTPDTECLPISLPKGNVRKRVFYLVFFTLRRVFRFVQRQLHRIK